MALCSVGTQWPVPAPRYRKPPWTRRAQPRRSARSCPRARVHTRRRPRHLQRPLASVLQVLGGGGAPEAPEQLTEPRGSSPSFLPLGSGPRLPHPPNTHPCCRLHAGATCTCGQHCHPRLTDEESEAQGGGGTCPRSRARRLSQAPVCPHRFLLFRQLSHLRVRPQCREGRHHIAAWRPRGSPGTASMSGPTGDQGPPL